MNMNMNNIQYTSEYDDASTRTFKHQHVVASRPAKKFERYLYNTVLLGQLNSIVKLNTNTNTNSD